MGLQVRSELQAILANLTYLFASFKFYIINYCIHGYTTDQHQSINININININNNKIDQHRNSNKIHQFKNNSIKHHQKSNKMEVTLST